MQDRTLAAAADIIDGARNATYGDAVEEIDWNFAKFLVGRDGRVVRRYKATTRPEDLAADIEALLA